MLTRKCGGGNDGAGGARIQVRGAGGSTVGTPLVLADSADRTITIALPEALFGTPASGWGFTVVLAGQDGFSPDQARAFTQYPGAYAFGVCPAGDTAPACELDPATVPKAMDVITPPGVSQATELDPTRGSAAIQPVTIP